MGQVMLLEAGNELYGIPLDAVVKVLDEEAITPIPRTPPGVAGATLFEGQAVPVFDIVHADSGRESDRLILMLVHENDLMGVAIDSVLRIVSSEGEELEEGIRSGQINGLPFKMVSPGELIPSGMGGSRGGEND